MYLVLPEGSFTQRLGMEGDSPQKELIHQIEHSRLRLEGLQRKPITSWKYSDTHKEEHVELLNSNKTKLIQALDETIVALFTTYRSNTDILNREIPIPFIPALTGGRMLEKIVLHDALHAGMLVKFCDFANVPRTAAMTKAWG